MTRSKDSPWSVRHEKHVARNGLTDIRGMPKKSGAGSGNWGCLGEELLDIQDVLHEQAVVEYGHAKDSKLQLVDHEAFETMQRREQQSH